MALNPELIDFFISNIQYAGYEDFGSEVAHLFEHLTDEIKQNPVFDKYEEDVEKWASFNSKDTFTLPTIYEESKSLIYSLYRSIAKRGPGGYELAWNITYTAHGDINDAVQKFNSQYIGYFEKSLSDIINANPEVEHTNIQSVQGNTVFIIHGHDNELKTEVQLLLTRAGVNNIVLHEQPDQGRTIIDKLIEESDKSNYAIALLSPDDTLDDGSERARQNVVLEIGYFIGRLGKERVRMIKKGEIEIPSDLQGILYENYDQSGAWKMKVCKELMAAGIYLDLEAVAQKL